jgi:hypothetical protein
VATKRSAMHYQFEAVGEHRTPCYDVSATSPLRASLLSLAGSPTRVMSYRLT